MLAALLDAAGVGTVDGALAGIEWVMYHAREYNIKVMNLSLAAQSTETWQTDPLCIAARAAPAAAGVVYAAGEPGAGQEAAQLRIAVAVAERPWRRPPRSTADTRASCSGSTFSEVGIRQHRHYRHGVE